MSPPDAPPTEPAAPRRTDWLLSAEERRNPFTRLDQRHPGGVAWSDGNAVEALVHGTTYFRMLLSAVRAMGQGDLLLFTDWRGDPDQRLDEPGSEVGPTFAAAARRGVVVRGLVWRSHLDRFQFSAAENRHLGEEIDASGGQCLLDMRVRPMGSHHQKLVVLRHPSRPDADVAFVGGIDLCHGRRDDSPHAGDPQRQAMAAVYGATPPWHDVQLAVRGPAVGDAEAAFRERWEDPAPLSRNPVHLVGERLFGEARRARPLPPQLPDPAPRGSQTVQLLRTYPSRRTAYPFAPDGERSVALGFRKALSRAEQLVHVEDQYLWSADVAEVFAEALRRAPELRMVVVLPRFPDQDGRVSLPPNLIARVDALRLLKQAGGDRVEVFGIENPSGFPVYVHAKVCVVDDVWACVGSANLNLRSWTHDSELSAAVLDLGPAPSWARKLRLQLVAEHLGADPAAPEVEAPAAELLDAFRHSAARLDTWHAAGRVGPRPPGQLRAYHAPVLGSVTRAWSRPLYRRLYDPDGRPSALRGAASF